MSKLIERFLKYVQIDTQSDPNSNTVPSTLKQLNLAKILLTELQELGLESHLDEYGYVYAKINSNAKKKITPIGFIAHMDTSFDAPGANVKPRIIKNYDGSLIKLNSTYQMDLTSFPVLSQVIGDDLIVTDGNTLLGADDKCGIAEIMQLAEFITSNPDFIHGDIYLCFTPDEEIGRGANYFNYDYFKAEFAYTLDGGAVGSIEFENFNAASAKIEFIGKSIHPGSAKDKLVNAILLAYEFHSLLPVFENPAYTQGYEGFNHLTNLTGSVESSLASYIIRNHDLTKFEQQKATFIKIKDYLNDKYGYLAVNLDLDDSYFNMYEIIKNKPEIISLAKQAILSCDIVPKVEPIRGGTDGARLTYEGLPCPNLGTGGYNFHGRYEFASINQMQKAVEIIIKLVELHSK